MTRPAALLLLLCTASAAPAIVIRHDRDDARYRELGARFPAVGHFGGRVDCTLIAPQWALGAAHTVEGIGPWDPPPRVVFGGESYGVVKIILHPARVFDTADTAGDLALFKLDRPVQGIAPVPLYEKDDELGKLAILVGHGQTGTGLTGPRDGERDNLVRGATNKIDRVDPTSIIFKFETPPDGTDLEGLAGPGDSGGPALLEQDGKLQLLGVGCFSGADEGSQGRYGTDDHYARVSTRRSWILDTMAADPPPTLNWSAPARFEGGSWPDTPAGRAAAALLRAYNGRDPAALEKFFSDFALPRPDRTAAERVRPLLELFETYGPYDLHSWSADGPRRIRVLVYSKKTSEWRSVGVDVNADGRAERMFFKDEAPPA